MCKIYELFTFNLIFGALKTQQSKAARVLALIAFGPSEYTNVIIHNGDLPYLVQLLISKGEDVHEMVQYGCYYLLTRESRVFLFFFFFLKYKTTFCFVVVGCLGIG